MTDKQKAEKYDALKMAISYNAKVYKNRFTRSLSDYMAHEGIIKGYDKGQADAYEEFVNVLEAWESACADGG